MLTSLNEILSNGLKAHKTGNLDLAEKIYRQILDKDPLNVKVLNLLGTLLITEKKYDEAFVFVQKANEICADAYSYINLLTIFIQKKDIDNIIKYFEKALEFKFELKNPEIFFCIAESYKIKQNFESAIKCYLKAIMYNPKNVEYYLACADVFALCKMYNEAINLLNAALKLDPKNYTIYAELGHLYVQTEKYDQVITSCENALKLKPDSAEVYNNMGIGYKYQNEMEKAVHCFKKAIDLIPDFVEAYYNLATTNLLLGNFEEGFKQYELRFKINLSTHPTIETDKPMWNGINSIQDKTILVCWEQGLGDSIQMARYFPLFEEYGAKVLVRTQDSLEKILKRSNLNVEFSRATKIKDLPHFDTYCYIMSLPYLFKTNLTNIPFSKGYLKADSEKVAYYKSKYFDNTKFKIGIKWQGSPKGDTSRNIPLNAFYQLADIPNVKLYSLQTSYGIDALENVPQNIEIVNLGETFNDFDDTAAAVENLDLVLCNDTSLAHLAGALGKTTWVLLNYIPEWRWLMKSSTSKWYDSIRLFRQGKEDSWYNLIERVKKEI